MAITGTYNSFALEDRSQSNSLRILLVFNFLHLFSSEKQMDFKNL